MAGRSHRDAFGFDGGMDADRGPRRIPDAGFPTGPEVGERVPDFALPDATGRVVSFHDDRAGQKTALVFIRSAVW